MPEVLQYLMEQSDEQFKRQIQYILEQLNSDAQQEGDQKEGKSINANEEEDEVDDEEEDEEDDDGEEKMFEGDDAEFNDNIEDQNIPKGEELLLWLFKASHEEAQY